MESNSRIKTAARENPTSLCGDGMKPLITEGDLREGVQKLF